MIKLTARQEQILGLIRDEIDILFGNEEEVFRLYEAGDLYTAIERLRAFDTQGVLASRLDALEAIAAALALAEPRDMVLLLGKGHEGSIIMATVSIPWDEARVAREILAGMGYTG